MGRNVNICIEKTNIVRAGVHDEQTQLLTLQEEVIVAAKVAGDAIVTLNEPESLVHCQEKRF